MMSKAHNLLCRQHYRFLLAPSPPDKNQPWGRAGGWNKNVNGVPGLCWAGFALLGAAGSPALSLSSVGAAVSSLLQVWKGLWGLQGQLRLCFHPQTWDPAQALGAPWRNLWCAGFVCGDVSSVEVMELPVQKENALRGSAVQREHVRVVSATRVFILLSFFSFLISVS